MKSGSKKTLKLVSATGMTLFSLVAVFAATWAWFSMITIVNGSGTVIRVDPYDGRLKHVYFHAFDDATPNDSTLSFAKTPFATYTYNWNTKSMTGTIPAANDSGEPWEMGAYEMEYRNHPMLIIFEFDKDYTSKTVGDMLVRGVTTVGGDSLTQHYADSDTDHLNPLYTTGGGFLGARTSTGSPFYNIETDKVANLLQSDTNPGGILIKQTTETVNEVTTTTDYFALSSVVTFRNRTFSEEQYGDFLVDNTGTTLDFPTSTLESDESFTTIKNDSDQYLFNQHPCLFKSNGTGDIRYIALTVEYYTDAIGYIYSTYLGDKGLNQHDSVLHFACDWSLEVY